MGSEQDRILLGWTLEGRNIVVTGGSNGIGLATVKVREQKGFFFAENNLDLLH
jgi:hypothetical protein